LSRKTKLVEQLDFSAATFSKLVKIGQEPRLQEAKVKALLPPNYSIVYEVAKLSSHELDAAIADEVITPTMARSDLEAWLSKRLGIEQAPAKQEQPRVVATVKVSTTFSDEQEAKLEEALKELQEEFGFELVQPRDPELEALSRMMRQIDDYIRKGARSYIRSLKKRTLSEGYKLTPAMRKRLWGYSEDELEILPDANWDQVQAVLDYVGNGDQFERLRDEALRLFGVSEKVVKEHPEVDHDEAMRELQLALKDIERQKGVLWGQSQRKLTPKSFESFK
jgi:hypothetical protein